MWLARPRAIFDVLSLTATDSVACRWYYGKSLEELVNTHSEFDDFHGFRGCR